LPKTWLHNGMKKTEWKRGTAMLPTEHWIKLALLQVYFMIYLRIHNSYLS